MNPPSFSLSYDSHADLIVSRKQRQRMNSVHVRKISQPGVPNLAASFPNLLGCHFPRRRHVKHLPRIPYASLFGYSILPSIALRDRKARRGAEPRVSKQFWRFSNIPLRNENEVSADSCSRSYSVSSSSLASLNRIARS